MSHKLDVTLSLNSLLSEFKKKNPEDLLMSAKFVFMVVGCSRCFPFY